MTLLTKNPELLDRCWMELAYALVGEQLDLGDDICGAGEDLVQDYVLPFQQICSQTCGY